MKNDAVNLIVAEDDEEDFLLVTEAFKAAALVNRITWVRDGEDLLDYLLRRGGYSGLAKVDGPYIILLDLKMPRMDGRQLLRELKAHPTLRRIPVIVMTTSTSDDDVTRAYDMGANSFLRKPVRLEEFVRVLTVFKQYWFDSVSLP